MQYFDPIAGAALKETVDGAVADWPGVSARTMFGCPSYRADGVLFAVLVTDGIALTNLDDASREELAEHHPTGPFQAGDRTVTKWVQVDVSDADVDSVLPFVRRSYETALAAADD